MSSWKKFVFVALICMLVLGLMLYGDLGNRFGGMGGRTSEFDSATINDEPNKKVVTLGAAQVNDIVTMFKITGIPAVIDPNERRQREATPEEMLASEMYYRHAFEVEHYPAAPGAIEMVEDSNVWRNQQRLVDKNDPERDALRQKRAGEEGTTVKALETFIQSYVAGSTKEDEFMRAFTEPYNANVCQPNRSELELLYQIAHERARVRYQSFPATQFYDAAKLEVAGDKDGLKKEYDADKGRQRTSRGETGDSVSQPLKLQFDMFWCEQETFRSEETDKLSKTDSLAEYKKLSGDFANNPAGFLSKKNAAVGPFKDFKTTDGKMLKINPDWAKLEKDEPLAPEDPVLEYIKLNVLVRQKIAARAARTMLDFQAKFNTAFTAAKIEDRAELPAHFLADLEKNDSVGFRAEFTAVHYLRTDLADYATYDAAHQEKITAATKTPNYLRTFFDHVNRGELKDFQTKLSEPLNYSIAWEDNKLLMELKPGGAICFIIHAVENLDPAASLMKFEDKDTQDLLIERLARQKAPELAEKAAKTMMEAWQKDPAQISQDPKVVTEYVAVDLPPDQEPNLPPEIKRQEQILEKILSGPVDPTTKRPSGDKVDAGVVVGPSEVDFTAPKTGEMEQPGAAELRKCYVIGFVAEYHQITDAAKRVEADPTWRNGNEHRMMEYFAGRMVSQALTQSVRDSYTVTLVKKKGS